MRLTTQQKRQIIREFDKKSNELEIRCAGELREFFTNLDTKIQNELSDDGSTHMIRSIIQEEWSNYIEILEEYCLQAYSLGKSLHSSLTRPVIKSNKLYIPFTLEFDIHLISSISSVYVQNRYTESVLNVLNTGYREGVGIAEITKRLTKLHNNFKNYEAHRIARTEIQSHRNKATFEQMKETGTEYKQWLTMEDELVRGNKVNDSADHVSLDLEIVPVDEPYSNGLMYPGDKSGPIEEWINCRCTSVPYVRL